MRGTKEKIAFCSSFFILSSLCSITSLWWSVNDLVRWYHRSVYRILVLHESALVAFVFSLVMSPASVSVYYTKLLMWDLYFLWNEVSCHTRTMYYSRVVFSHGSRYWFGSVTDPYVNRSLVTCAKCEFSRLVRLPPPYFHLCTTVELTNPCDCWTTCAVFELSPAPELWFLLMNSYALVE